MRFPADYWGPAAVYLCAGIHGGICCQEKLSDSFSGAQSDPQDIIILIRQVRLNLTAAAPENLSVWHVHMEAEERRVSQMAFGKDLMEI